MYLKKVKKETEYMYLPQIVFTVSLFALSKAIHRLYQFIYM